jgi:Ca-activated chloride channel family protein
MLDQIRANGAKKELVQEVITLAKKYSIATPYTSYLIVPDGAIPVVGQRPPQTLPGRPAVGFNGGGGLMGMGGMGGMGMRGVPAGLAPATPASTPVPVLDFAKRNQAKPGDLAVNRGERADKELHKVEGKDAVSAEGLVLGAARDKKEAYDRARSLLGRRAIDGVQAGKLGVDLSCQMQNLRTQCRLEQTALRNVYGRNCLEIGGVWIDENFDAKMPTMIVKAQSEGYFKLLARQPKLKEVFKLGNHLVWVAPCGTALVIDASNGKEKLSEEEIDKLFVAKK